MLSVWKRQPMTASFAPTRSLLPTLFRADEKAEQRFLEFFTAHLANDHTRKAYLNAMKSFAAWCDLQGLWELSSVQPIHVAAYIQTIKSHYAAPTVKQHLATIRMLFAWLVIGHVIDVNPAHAVRAPKYSVKKGKTPVLTPDESRELLDSIDASTLIGLRDRALIGLMVYTFAHVGAAIHMRVEDYFIQGRRGWVRLHEKGGKLHMPPIPTQMPFRAVFMRWGCRPSCMDDLVVESFPPLADILQT
jgi:integrase/recombinase XerD